MRSLAAMSTAMIWALVTGSPAHAGLDEGEILIDRTSNSVEIEIGYSEPGQAVGIGSNPFIDCAMVWNITGDEALDYAGARGQFENGIDTSISAGDSTSTDLYHFVSCPRFAPPILMVWPDGDPVPPLILDALLVTAKSRLQIPVESPQANPPGTEDFAFITQMPVWFWSDTYGTRSATASLAELAAPIDASITATATAVETIWDPGDGAAPLVCEEGLEWSPEVDDVDPPCAHTYKKRTDGTPLTLSSTTTWLLSVGCQPAVVCADIGPLDPISTTTSRQVFVESVFPVLTG